VITMADNLLHNKAETTYRSNNFVLRARILAHNCNDCSFDAICRYESELCQYTFCVSSIDFLGHFDAVQNCRMSNCDPIPDFLSIFVAE